MTTLSGSNSELLVIGYTHDHINRCKHRNNINFSNIPIFPQELNKVIFLYFFSRPRDAWDPKCHSCYFEIVDNNEEVEEQQEIKEKMNSYQSLICNNNDSIDENGPMIIVNTKSIVQSSTYIHRFGSAYLKNIVHEGKHDWKFKIEDRLVGWWVFIGIWKVGRGKMVLNGWFNSEIADNSYAFSAGQGQIVDPMDPNKHSWQGSTRKGNTAKDYGVKCKKGDIIDMHLDFYERTLAYSINGKNYGIAFSNIEETYYRAVVGLFYTTDRIRLLSYKYQYLSLN